MMRCEGLVQHGLNDLRGEVGLHSLVRRSLDQDQAQPLGDAAPSALEGLLAEPVLAPQLVHPRHAEQLAAQETLQERLVGLRVASRSSRSLGSRWASAL